MSNEPVQVPDDQADLFIEPVKEVPPSQGVYCDMGDEEMFYVGEVQMPRPLPVEIVVEIDGWDYLYKLESRVRSAK